MLVDGIPVFDVNKFLSISPSEIDKVEIINNNYILGEIVYGGIINVFTKKKNFAGVIDTKNLTFSEFKGYSEKNKFTESVTRMKWPITREKLILETLCIGILKLKLTKTVKQIYPFTPQMKKENSSLQLKEWEKEEKQATRK